MNVQFDNSYARLPAKFFTQLTPTPVASPKTIRVNDDLAELLGFDPDWLRSHEGASFAAGNEVVEGSLPIATVYGGHQFGGWSGQLGDGRAHLLGEVIASDGVRYDVQLKGSGQTPYSRRGDGRSPLGPVLREYIVSEAMDALGIPTTRSLVAATTGETVRRQTALPGGVLVRVAKSHIRVGTFEFFAWRGDADGVRTLLAHAIERHYPDLAPDDLVGFLRGVAQRQASLIAQWQLVGFIHGVMNTDNMLVSGETIDYGPCAFMNTYDPATVYSSIDRHGRYAYGNQPAIGQWNIAKLAEALLIADESSSTVAQAQQVVDDFPDLFRDAYTKGFARKLGFDSFESGDLEMVTDFLELLYESESDYTLGFRRLADVLDGDETLAGLFEFDDGFEPWLERWKDRLAGGAEIPGGGRTELAEKMRSVNPVLIPRNHQVEKAIEDAVEREDFAPFHALVDALNEPFETPEQRALLSPPEEGEKIEATFCGT